MSNPFLRARLVRRSLPCLAAVVLGVGGATQAATFLPSPGEFSRLPATTRDITRRAVEHLNLHARNPGEPIVKDDMLFRSDDVMKRSGFTGTLWTKGVVYYQFDPLVDLGKRERWRAAAAGWSAVANLKFVEGTGVGNYIYVQDSPDANNSYVGMIGGGQPMNITNWERRYIIAHEIGHALGLEHEQCRSDRDAYVLVLTRNVIPSAVHNFDIAQTTNYGAYDFDSVMHYDRWSFSANGNDTLQPKNAYLQYLNTMGQRNELSFLDKAGMAARYGAIVLPAKIRAHYEQQIRKFQHKLNLARHKLTGAAKVAAIRKWRQKINAVQTRLRGY